MSQSLLIQLGVKEIVLAGDDQTADYDAKKLRAMVERCSIVATDRKKCKLHQSWFLDWVGRELNDCPRPTAEFKGDNVEQDLNRLLRGKLAAAARRKFQPTPTRRASRCTR